MKTVSAQLMHTRMEFAQENQTDKNQYKNKLRCNATEFQHTK